MDGGIIFFGFRTYIFYMHFTMRGSIYIYRFLEPPVGNSFSGKNGMFKTRHPFPGVKGMEELGTTGYEKTLVTNHLSHFLITNLLLDKIKKSSPARIINVSSDSHLGGKWNPEDIHLTKKYKVLWAYGNSKLYNVLFTKYLANLLKDTRVTVNCLHPRVVQTKIGTKNTNLVGGVFWNLYAAIVGISEEKGAQTTIYLATSPEVEQVTGKYFVKCKETPSSPISNDPKVAEDLWNMSMKMVNL